MIEASIMNHSDMEDVRREIDAQTRIRDESPELVPTALARELANYYPADVKRNPNRLASLAGEIIRRERRSADDERAVHLRETMQLRNTIRHLQVELAKARQQTSELEAAPIETTALNIRLPSI